MNTLLVTGASGYIGSHLVSRLLARGERVVGVDLQESLFPGAEGYHHVKSDVRNPRNILQATSDFPISGIFHLATSSSMPESYNAGEAYLDLEREKNESVAEIARASDKCQFVAFSSSCSVYGNVLDGEVVETTEVSPISPYAKGKVHAEHFFRRELGRTGVRLAIFRFFNVVGRDPSSGLREHHVPETHLLPNAVTAATDGKHLEIFGNDFETTDGTAVRDFVDVRDLVIGLVGGCEFLLESGRQIETWNLSSNQTHSVLEVVNKVEIATGKKIAIKFLEKRKGDPARAVANCEKARKDGFWKPRYSLEDSIASLVT